MPDVDLLLNPRDPLLFRDARPFSADPGAYAASLPWPLPGTVLGTLRTAIGNAAKIDWKNQNELDRILDVSLGMMFRVVLRPGSSFWDPYVPSPLDALPYTGANGDAQLMRLSPEQPVDDAACLWPKGEKDLLPLKVTEDVKPLKGQNWWHMRHVIDWLINPHPQPLPSSDPPLPDLPSETRTHVAIERNTQSAADGMLFATEGRVFQTLTGNAQDRSESAIWCQLTIPDSLPQWTDINSFVPLGGERRPTSLERANESIACQLGCLRDTAVSSMKDSHTFRLMLLTPAIFAKGWKPSTRLDSLFDGHKLRLRGAAVGTRVPVSGWNMATRAPKPTRFAAPAGSVYFFESDQQLTNEIFERLWMASISDDEQDRRDGYGLCVPGTWKT